MPSDAFTSSFDTTTNWTQQIGTFTWGSLNTVIFASDAEHTMAVWKAGAGSVNHESQIAIDTPFDYVGVAVRLTGTAGTTCGYMALYSSSANSVAMYRCDNNVFTQIGSTITSITFSGGDTFKMGITSSTITVYQNGGSIGTVSDGTYSTGAYGVYAYGTTAKIDSWLGNDLAAGGGADHKPLTLLGVG